MGEGIVSHALGSQTRFMDGVETDRPFFFIDHSSRSMHRLPLASLESNFSGGTLKVYRENVT